MVVEGQQNETTTTTLPPDDATTEVPTLVNSNTNSCHDITPDVAGCDNTECQTFVCGILPECCNENWGDACVRTALLDVTTSCPYTDEYIDYNCFQSPQPADSTCDPSCRGLICLDDPTCCDIIHGQSCANLALERCELPVGDGTNTCFEVSSNDEPGCHNVETCLPKVCEQNIDCCGISYTEECVTIARQFPIDCPPPTSTNSCYETSVTGGCSQSDCQSIVCDVDSTCCNSVTEIGEYTQTCVDIAIMNCPRYVRFPRLKK